MKAAEIPLLDPQDDTLLRATRRFRAGDFKRAREDLERVERASLAAPDQAVFDRLKRALTMDPVFVYGLVGAALLWGWLFWQNTGVG